MLKLLLIPILLFNLCSCSKQKVTEGTKVEKSNFGTSTFHVRGLIKSIPPNKGHVVVDHEEIPDFMMAMRMPFDIPDSAMLEGLKSNDSIKMVITYDGEEILLKRIEPIY